MNDDRRRDERWPNVRYVKLVELRPGAGEKVYPLILRDISSSGLGALFIGNRPLDPDGQYRLRDAEGSERPVRIVWIRQVADLVHILGMKFLDD